jgi:hypothetical protein
VPKTLKWLFYGVQNDLCIGRNGRGDTVVWRNLLFDVSSSENDSRVQLVVGVGVGTMRNLYVAFNTRERNKQCLDTHAEKKSLDRFPNVYQIKRELRKETSAHLNDDTPVA